MSQDTATEVAARMPEAWTSLEKLSSTISTLQAVIDSLEARLQRVMKPVGSEVPDSIKQAVDPPASVEIVAHIDAATLQVRMLRDKLNIIEGRLEV